MIKSKVKSILNDIGMTQMDLAAKLGITPETLSRTINGNPTLKSLTDIADALDVELIELFSSSKPRGYVDYGGAVRKIHSVKDLHQLIRDIEQVE